MTKNIKLKSPCNLSEANAMTQKRNFALYMDEDFVKKSKEIILAHSVF